MSYDDERQARASQFFWFDGKDVLEDAKRIVAAGGVGVRWCLYPGVDSRTGGQTLWHQVQSVTATAGGDPPPLNASHICPIDCP